MKMVVIEGRETLQALDGMIEELEDTGIITDNHFECLVRSLGGNPKTLDRILDANGNDQIGITHAAMCYMVALVGAAQIRGKSSCGGTK